jgi:uncharacterized repeat protein (TIGR03803 family)
MTFHRFARAVGTVSLALALPVAAHAGSFQTLYTFAGGNDDGASPQDTLTFKNGVLYGTTQRGGPNDAGTVFSFDTQAGTETVISSTMGSLPFTPVTWAAGKIFGTTSAADNGEGNIFSINPATGAVLDLAQFARGPELADPSGLTLIGTTLYGATANGGAPNFEGTIFSYDMKSKNAATLHVFSGGDGAGPIGGLVQHQGALYGLTLRGGAQGNGALFKFDPATGTQTVLHSFGGSGDGSWPDGITFSGSTIYGTTLFGGANGQGALFKLDLTTGMETVIYSFTGGAAGCVPFSRPVIYRNHLYGVTGSCGDGANQGVLFDFGLASGKLNILQTFSNGPNGVTPGGGLVLGNGTLYGTTSFGGAHNAGTIFSYTP